MKKVLVPKQSEEATFYCDSCGIEAFGQLSIHFWYGSKMDMSQAQIHLCDDCAKRIMESLKTNFGIDIHLNEITEI